MRKTLALLGVFTLVVVSGQARAAEGYLPLWSEQKGHIADLVLIYQGGKHRPEWNQDQLLPYVSWQNSSRSEQWLFDGFLFLEFKDGKGRDYALGYGGKPARQTEWLWLLNRNFDATNGLGALNAVVGAAEQRLGKPRVKRKVVLTLPEPIHGQTDWGSLEGRALDFNRDADRIAACRWHVEQARLFWKKANYEHLELAGFYWVAEHAAKAKTILPAVGDMVREANLKFYWIPYWRANGAAQWRELGFDFAWQQPNHFFHPEVPDSRLGEATTFARTNNLGLEFEADFRAAGDSARFRPRFYKYLAAFERDGVKQGASVAYYEGGGALGKMAESNDPAVRALYDALCTWIVQRQAQIPPAAK